MQMLYEVTGYPVSCPSERFSLGIYKTESGAENAIIKARAEYSNCEFEIEVKTYGI